MRLTDDDLRKYAKGLDKVYGSFPVVREMASELLQLREQTRWIPCKERYPELDAGVYGYSTDNQFEKYKFGTHMIDGEWHYLFDGEYRSDFTHWMPLPPKPEDE